MRNAASHQRGSSSIGFLMFFGSLVTIGFCLINYFYNRFQANEHPWITLFSGGTNLSKYGYNFLPPYTGFEIAVLVIGGIGFFIIAASD